MKTEPVLICPSCGNTDRFLMKTILRYQGEDGRYLPENAGEAFRFLREYASNILFVNSRFVGDGARIPFSQHYGPKFIRSYNTSMHTDIALMRKVDIRVKYPNLTLYGGLVYCQGCATLACLKHRVG